MVQCKTSAPKAFTKGDCRGLQNVSIFLLINVTCRAISGIFISLFGSWAGQDFSQIPSLQYWETWILVSPNVRNCLFRNYRFNFFCTYKKKGLKWGIQSPRFRPPLSSDTTRRDISRHRIGPQNDQIPSFGIPSRLCMIMVPAHPL